MEILEIGTLKYLYVLVLHISISDVYSSTTYCPPLIAPNNTNLSCITSRDEQLVDCASTWLPDGSIAYFRCTEENELQLRFGKIICKGSYEMVNNEPYSEIPISSDNADDPLPCGIKQMPANSEFHFYGFEKPPHYPDFMNVTNNKDFRAGGMKLLNYFRQQHQVPPLEMDALLNEKAQSWSDTLSIRNSLDLATEDFIGQNVFNSDQDELSLAINDAIQFWYLQGLAKYNWDDIKSNWENSLALDFSQIVWKSTRKLGLGASNRKLPIQKGSVVVAFYFPMGNIVLDNESGPDKMFVENVLKKNSSTSVMY